MVDDTPIGCFKILTKTSNKEQQKRRQSESRSKSMVKEQKALANGYKLEDDDSIMGDDADLEALYNSDSSEADSEEDFENLAKTLEKEPFMARLGLFISSPRIIFTTHTVSFVVFLFLFGKIVLFRIRA